MITVISASSNKIDAPFDKRFGRAAWFCLFNENTGEIVFKENLNKNIKEHIGVKTTVDLVELGMTRAISGDFGPGVIEVLNKNNVQMIIIDNDSLSVEDILKQIKK